MKRKPWEPKRRRPTKEQLEALEHTRNRVHRFVRSNPGCVSRDLDAFVLNGSAYARDLSRRGELVFVLTTTRANITIAPGWYDAHAYRADGTRLDEPHVPRTDPTPKERRAQVIKARRYALVEVAGVIRGALSHGDDWTRGGPDASVQEERDIEAALNRIADTLERQAQPRTRRSKWR